MRKTIYAICLMMSLLFLGSCIREEALNAEADIITCTLDGDVLQGKPVIENDYVVLYVKKSVDAAQLSQLAPKFELTPGARISPESGTKMDFNTTPNHEYVVTSEDGQWKKTYRVTVTKSTAIQHFDFKDVSYAKDSYGNDTYQILNYSNPTAPGVVYAWASGNSGYDMTGMAKSPMDFPTTQSPIGGYLDFKECAILTTCRTGSFGEMVNMPIAAGNLFLGTFNTKIATSRPLEATEFGTPWSAVPKRISGWYKYKPGEVFYELDKSAPHKMRECPGKVDEFNIYAVFYEATDAMHTLDGTNYMKEDMPNIISVAKIAPEERVAAREWRNFSIDFDAPHHPIDEQKLEDGTYKLAIVFTSSIHGDVFSGAPGSELWVDEVHISYE